MTVKINKKLGLIAALILLAGIAGAAAPCEVQPSAVDLSATHTKVLGLLDQSNAHATNDILPTSTAPYFVWCPKTFFLDAAYANENGSGCYLTDGTPLTYFYDDDGYFTNDHVRTPDSSGIPGDLYATSYYMCVQLANPSWICYSAPSCDGASEAGVASLSETTNAHISDYTDTAFTTKLCCGVPGAIATSCTISGPPTIEVGTTEQFSTICGGAPCPTMSWSAAPPNIVTVPATGNPVDVQGDALGTATLTASGDAGAGPFQCTAGVDVIPAAGADLVRIDITSSATEYQTPDPIMLTVNVTKQAGVGSISYTVIGKNAVDQTEIFNAAYNDATNPNPISVPTDTITGQGNYTFTARITTIAPGDTQAGNTDSVTVLLNTSGGVVATPDIHPIFVVVIALAIVLLISREKR